MFKKKKTSALEKLAEQDKERAVRLAYEIELLAQQLVERTQTLKKELNGKKPTAGR